MCVSETIATRLAPETGLVGSQGLNLVDFVLEAHIPAGIGPVKGAGGHNLVEHVLELYSPVGRHRARPRSALSGRNSIGYAP